MGYEVKDSGQLKVRIIDIDASRPIVLMHERDAERLSIHVGDRVTLCRGNRCGGVGIVDVTDTMVDEGEVGVFNDLATPMKLLPQSQITVMPRGKPESVGYIRKKIDGVELSEYEINSIIKDIVDDNLSDIELTGFVTASAIHGFTRKETVALTLAMVNTGDHLDFEGDVVDKHCIGGVPGNRTTMMMVPMLSSLGLKIPKTSSRAITSPSGTADTMEVLAPVSYGAEDIRKFIAKEGGCIVWGGAVNLAPADDKIIRVEYPLSVDAEGQVLASIISKKKSVGSDYVLVDIPYGLGAKISDKVAAKELGKKFVDLGQEVDMKVRYILTDGTKPIGNGVGPVLEAIDVLRALNNEGPKDLIEKSIMMVSEVMHFSGNATKAAGKKEARSIIEDGTALKKMRKIIKMQGGDPDVKPEDLKPGKFKKDIVADRSGEIVSIDNILIARTARTAGAPKDPAAGLYIEKTVGDKVEKGDVLFTIYSESKTKLGYALNVAEGKNPFTIR